MAKPKKQHPFLPMFVGDFFAATAEWEGEAEALYALLLMRQWSIGHLPAEVGKLARLVKYDPATFERWWVTVGSKFDVVEVEGFGPRLVNHRLENHRAKSKALSEKNSQAGKKGAESKWHKDGARHQEDLALGTRTDGARHKSAIATGDGNPSHPIPSHPDPELLPPLAQDSCVSLPTSRARVSHAPEGDEEGGNPGAGGGRTQQQQTGDGWSDEAQHAEWEATAALYPPNPARADWIGAEKAARELVETAQATWPELRAAVNRYAKLCTATNRLVTNPVKFFTDSDKPWSQPWPVQAAAAPKRMRTAHEIAAAYPEDAA